MKKILYPSRIKNSNMGDLLINSLLVRELCKNNIVLLDGMNIEFMKSLNYLGCDTSRLKIIDGVKFFSGKPVLRWFNLIPYIASLNAVFDPPGAYSDKSNNFKSILKYYKYFFRSIVLSILNIKMYRVGVSIGPLCKDGLQRQRKLSEKYSLIGIRDSANLSTLNSLGFQNLFKVEDLAFLYNYSSKNELDNAKKSVCISFRGAIDGESIDEVYLSSIINSLINIKEHFLDKKIIICYQVDEDYEVCKLLYSKFLDNNISSTLIEKKLSLPEAIELYSNSSEVFTNRLHVGLFALLNNTTAYVITDLGKHSKLVNIYNDLGLENLLIDLNQYPKLDINEDLSVFKCISQQKSKDMISFIEKLNLQK